MKLKLNMKKFLASMPSAAETAKEHAAADKRCGRKWVCQCAACRQTREEIRNIGK